MIPVEIAKIIRENGCLSRFLIRKFEKLIFLPFFDKSNLRVNPEITALKKYIFDGIVKNINKEITAIQRRSSQFNEFLVRAIKPSRSAANKNEKEYPRIWSPKFKKGIVVVIKTTEALAYHFPFLLRPINPTITIESKVVRR
jgi:hypothetical protein